jgi:hypothetical protein
MSALVKFIKGDLVFFLFLVVCLNIAHTLLFRSPDDFDVTQFYVFAALATVLRRLDRMEASQ